MPTALITGITGQDGSYLAEHLISLGYIVHGVMRRSSSFTTGRIDHLLGDRCTQADEARKAVGYSPKVTLHYGDMLDPLSLRGIIGKVKPDEVYNLASQSHVGTSYKQPVYSFDVAGTGTLHLLEAIRDYRDSTGHEVKFYQASSSEMFGNSPPKQNENTPFRPRSPYAIAKVAAYWHTVMYREAYGMFACNGILFNHESPRRGETFVTRKVTRAIGRIVEGVQDKLYLGNLTSWRDWGFAGDYVKAMQRMLQVSSSDDYVVATGVSCQVQDFVSEAFGYVGLDWNKYVELDVRYIRPLEADHLEGDAHKACARLGWGPTTNVSALIRIMVDSDVELAKRENRANGLGTTNHPTTTVSDTVAFEAARQ